MKPLIFFLTLSALTPLYGESLKHLSGAGSDARIDAIGFKRTQKWGGDFLKYLRVRPKFLKSDWAQHITLPPPPANSSPKTKAEITSLQSLVSKRQNKLPEIKAEVLVTKFSLGGLTYESLTTLPKYRATSQLILGAYHDLAIPIFKMKERFDRVRPSIMKKDLGQAIDIPTHPAYPSGHASIAYTLAYLLQELDPSNSEKYLKDAQRISENREIAGLHYPSDTEAGRLLARQVVDQLLSRPNFQNLFKAAKKEWPKG